MDDSTADLTPKPATDRTAARNAAAASAAHLATSRSERERARRGLVARPDDPTVDHPGGWAVWDHGAFEFLDDDSAPPEVHPSLWEQARRNTEAGLFEVAPGFHQVRGFDLANLTVVDGEKGRIVIDPLTSNQTAAAAMALVDRHLGERPVTAVIYTHSHVDHFAGVRGVIDEADVMTGGIPVIAPSGFLAAAVSENVVAGVAMTRRASYMYGALLPKGTRGHVDAGLGKGIPLLADQSLIAPTVHIAETGTELVVDGVRIVFQVTPDTEAPAEMNFHFPDHRVLCLAENCTCTLHNLYTPRGAPVRDALAWSQYLQEAIDLYADVTDVAFASHHWPRWGREEIVGHLGRQRDGYRFLHDQVLRLANHGLTSTEIAEELRLPPALEADTALRGYYGTVSHNAKAVYQRYLGWFDGNPAHLQPHPPAEASRRYVDYMGGPDEVLRRARVSFDEGDYRWVAEVVGHVVFADPDNVAARGLQADAFEQLGYQSESAPWRDFYLTGAQELRNGHPSSNPGHGPSPETVAAIDSAQLVDALGVRLDGLRAAERSWVVDVTITDRDERVRFGVSNGAVHHERPDGEVPAGAVVVLAAHAAFGAVVFGSATIEDLEAAGQLQVSAGREDLEALLAVCDSFSLMFPIVTP
ncbi:MAG: MBL fold metallo-hydrolase [Acidimicrobiales bacterium]|nr:MBL fold metallo-hydrolase [Acidimicrobiales bacterium]